MKTPNVLLIISIVALVTSCTKDEMVMPQVELASASPFIYYGDEMPGQISFEIKGIETISLNKSDASHINIADNSQALLVEQDEIPATYTLSAPIPAGFDSLRIYVGSSHHEFYATKVTIKIGEKSFEITDKDLSGTVRFVKDTSVTDTWNNPGGHSAEFPINMDGVNLVGGNNYCNGHSYTNLRFSGGLSQHAGEVISVTVTGTITQDDDVNIGAFGGDASFIPLAGSGAKIGYHSNFGQKNRLLYKWNNEKDIATK